MYLPLHFFRLLLITFLYPFSFFYFTSSSSFTPSLVPPPPLPFLSSLILLRLYLPSSSFLLPLFPLSSFLIPSPSLPPLSSTFPPPPPLSPSETSSFTDGWPALWVSVSYCYLNMTNPRPFFHVGSTAKDKSSLERLYLMGYNTLGTWEQFIQTMIRNSPHQLN